MSALAALVLGGGLGGLAAALALARKGCGVRLFEQGSELKEIGAGIQLGPNVYHMFEVLGLTQAIERWSAPPENLIMVDALTGEEVTRRAVPFARRGGTAEFPGAGRMRNDVSKP